MGQPAGKGRRGTRAWHCAVYSSQWCFTFAWRQRAGLLPPPASPLVSTARRRPGEPRAPSSVGRPAWCRQREPRQRLTHCACPPRTERAPAPARPTAPRLEPSRRRFSPGLLSSPRAPESWRMVHRKSGDAWSRRCRLCPPFASLARPESTKRRHRRLVNIHAHVRTCQTAARVIRLTSDRQEGSRKLPQVPVKPTGGRICRQRVLCHPNMTSCAHRSVFCGPLVALRENRTSAADARSQSRFCRTRHRRQQSSDDAGVTPSPRRDQRHSPARQKTPTQKAWRARCQHSCRSSTSRGA